MREEEGGGRFARRMPPAEVGNPEIPESHIHTFHHGSTLLLENSDGPLQFRPGTGAGGDGSEMRSCRGQLLTLEKFPGSHRSARAVKGCPMKSIATLSGDGVHLRAPPTFPSLGKIGRDEDRSVCKNISRLTSIEGISIRKRSGE